MLATRRTGRRSERREMSARARHRVYVGNGVTRRARSRVFLARSTQHVTSGTILGDCLGAAATLVGIAGWGTVLVLFGA